MEDIINNNPVNKAYHMEFLTKMRLKFKQEELENKNYSLYINEEQEKRRLTELNKIRQ
jgi:hypothetical protein